MDANDILRSINKALSLLIELHDVPSTHETLTALAVMDLKERIMVSVNELRHVQDQFNGIFDYG